MSSQTQTGEYRCPQCNEPVHYDSAFCGNCGASLSATTAKNDDQATTTFAPISSDTDEGGFRTASEASPWASPDSDRYGPPSRFEEAPATGHDPNATVIGSHPDYMSGGARPAEPQGVRGFFLGILALILIGAVLALYLYDAWLSESARETVESWLPWLE